MTIRSGRRASTDLSPLAEIETNMPARPSWKQLLKQWRNRGAQPVPVGPLVRLEVSDEPVVEDPAIYGLTAEEYQQIQDISEKVNFERPGQFVVRLEQLIEQYPQVPKLWNHLAVAYQSAGRQADYERIVEETYRRFPDYWFGFVLLATLRLDQKRADDVTAMLGGKLAIQDLQHGRLSYHISEIMAYYLLMVRYHLALGKPEWAGRYLDDMEQLEPKHPATEQARSRMLLDMAETMLQATRRQRSKRSGPKR